MHYQLRLSLPMRSFTYLYCLLDDMNRISYSTDTALASAVCAWPVLDLYTRVCRCEFSTSCRAVLFCYFIEEWECGSLLELKQHWFITLFNVHTRVKIWSTSWCQTVFLVFWSWSHACCLVLGCLDKDSFKTLPFVYSRLSLTFILVALIDRTNSDSPVVDLTSEHVDIITSASLDQFNSCLGVETHLPLPPPHKSHPDDVSHCRILSPDKTEWRLISATHCGWRCCFVADQLWFMTRIRGEDTSPPPYLHLETLRQCLPRCTDCCEIDACDDW